MRAIIQRISKGEVRVAGEVAGKTKQGLMVLIGFSKEDAPKSRDGCISGGYGSRYY